jgi:hypothetical protein
MRGSDEHGSLLAESREEATNFLATPVEDIQDGRVAWLDA